MKALYKSFYKSFQGEPERSPLCPGGVIDTSPALQCRVGHLRKNSSRRDGGKRRPAPSVAGIAPSTARTTLLTWNVSQDPLCRPGFPTSLRDAITLKSLQGLNSLATVQLPLRGEGAFDRAVLKTPVTLSTKLPGYRQSFLRDNDALGRPVPGKMARKAGCAR